LASEKKAALRRLLIEKRDGISHSLMEINAKKIHANLKRVPEFRLATRIGLYYPTGSEVFTQSVMQEAISNGLTVCLPKIVGDEMEFREISGFSSLEPGSFDLMEPKDACPVASGIEVVIVPAVGISVDGHRIGYGAGFYDRYLAKSSAVRIALCFQRQVVRAIPHEGHDIRMDYAVTEERIYVSRQGWKAA